MRDTIEGLSRAKKNQSYDILCRGSNIPLGISFTNAASGIRCDTFVSGTKVGKINLPTFETNILSNMRIWGIRILLWAIISFFTGSFASLFLWGLDEIAKNRQAYFLFGLPFVGYVIYLSRRWDFAKQGTNDLIKHLQGGAFHSSYWLAPFTLVSTWLSHLVGASVGREGAAVFMGGAIAQTSSAKFQISTEEKSIWIRAGISAGFAAIFGTPWAGYFFGLEIKEVGKIHLRSIFACLATAFAANYVSLHVYGTKHVLYPAILLPTISGLFWAKLALIGLFLSLMARTYKALESNIFLATDKLPVKPTQKAILGGFVLLVLFQFSFFQESIGLGSEFLLRPFSDHFESGIFSIQKLIATSLSLGLGFKGGEATPLFLIGAHATAGISEFIQLPGPFLAAIGFTCLYMGLTKTPIAATCMGVELFGQEAWFCYLIVTLIIILLSGKKGLFQSQSWASYFPKLPV
jgi:H+/Cl- antiporter ClcA